MVSKAGRDEASDTAIATIGQNEPVLATRALDQGATEVDRVIAIAGPLRR